jgi:hypothetical protein
MLSVTQRAVAPIRASRKAVVVRAAQEPIKVGINGACARKERGETRLFSTGGDGQGFFPANPPFFCCSGRALSAPAFPSPLSTAS